jgi:hypothetical protein
MGAKGGNGLTPPDEQPITARLAGAGSLRRELEAVLAVVPPGTSPLGARDLILNANAAAKSSQTARLWAWKRLKLRYLLDPAIPEGKAFLAEMLVTKSPSDRGLLALLMFARTDRLFREVTLECVSPQLRQAGVLIDPLVVDAAVKRCAEANGLDWSATTLDRVHQHLLTALKDFGLLRGSRPKRTVQPQPGSEVSRFACRLGRLEGLTDRQALDSSWFRLLGLDRVRVVDLLYRARRDGALDFRMQADVVEIVLPRLEAA